MYYMLLHNMILYRVLYYMPLRPVLDVSLLGLYLLFFNDFMIRRPVKSWSHWGAVWIFLCIWEGFHLFKQANKLFFADQDIYLLA